MKWHANTMLGFIKKNIKTILKAAFYLVLLICYTKFYFAGQLIELLKHRTQFSAKIEYVKEIPIPAFTFCMKPYLKPSMASKHGFHTMVDILDSKNASKWDFFKSSISYVLGEDFTIDIFTLEGSKEITFNLSLGAFNEQGVNVVIESVSTLRHGLCYLVKTDYNASVSTVEYFGYQITFNSSLPKSDIPKEIEVYLTSPHGWYGIFFDDWPYFEPTYFTIPTKVDTTHEWVNVLVPTELTFLEGIQDSEECFEKFMESVNCTKLCFPIVLNHVHSVGPCQTYEEQQCVYKAITNERNAFVQCLKPVSTMQYR